MNQAQKCNPLNNKAVFVLILVCFFCVPTLQYFSKITNMNKVASKTISNYQTDFASCSCDIHPTICDNYCCCDTICSSSQISTWSSNSLCRNTTTPIESSCDSVSLGGNIAFDQLACVYYSNRGSIGYFYNYPSSGNINYPSANKFAAQISSMSAIDQTSTTATTSAYSSSSSTTSLLKMTKDGTLKYFQLLTPVAGGQCGIGYLNLTQTFQLSSTTNYYECQYHLTSSTCASSTTQLAGTVLICINGNCSTTQSLPTVTPASSDGTTCSNMITSQSITITLSSSSSAYIISSATVTITQSSVTLAGNQKYPVKTTVVINKPATSTSGNPGYLLGKPVTLLNGGSSFNFFNIGDSAGNCLTSGSTLYSVNFGQNSIQSCKSSSPCSSSLYVDSLIKKTTLTINQYASQSTSTISVSGTNSSFNSCTYQTIMLNIVYSQDGWQADPQFYIVGASMSYLPSAQTSFNSKYLKINWIYVDPGTIVTPPTNYFYQYFSYLWTPLRQYFGVY